MLGGSGFLTLSRSLVQSNRHVPEMEEGVEEGKELLEGSVVASEDHRPLPDWTYIEFS